MAERKSQIRKYKLEFRPEWVEEYPSHSAVRKIITEIPVADKDETIGEVLSRVIREVSTFQTIDYIYVISKNNVLIGVVSLKTVLSCHKELKIGKVMKTKLITAPPEADPDMVADLAVKHRLKAIPIVKNKQLVGIVPMEQILPILNKVLREDLLHLAGIHKSHLKYENTLTVPLFAGILHRLPWLLVGLAGITVSALFISIFEILLQKYLILAFFIPVIVYMSDALGTQHQMLFIRDLAIQGQGLNVKKYFLRQMSVGSLLALALGIVTSFITLLFWDQPVLAFVIASAMTITLVITSFTAIATTFLINYFKMDPALGSGPLATIISDVTSIIIYFAVAFVLLAGV